MYVCTSYQACPSDGDRCETGQMCGEFSSKEEGHSAHEAALLKKYVAPAWRIAWAVSDVIEIDDDGASLANAGVIVRQEEVGG